MAPKKPSAYSLNEQVPITRACPVCEYLEQQVDGAINQITEVLEARFQSVKEKVQELHKWQESRDKAIEEFYAHKRMHRLRVVNALGRKIA